MSRSRWYRLLLKAYPREFRERFGREMEESFVRLLEAEGRRGGMPGRWVVRAGAVWEALRLGVSMRLGLVGQGARVNSRNGRTGGREMMSSFVTDLRLAIRGLLKRPVFTLTAVATLALGIGATTAIFTVFNGLLIRPFPYEDPDELAMVYATQPERGWNRVDVSLADAWYFREEARSLEDLAVYDERSANLTGGETPERLNAIAVTPNVFGLLGVSPAVGRDFTWDDNRPGAPGAAILSDGFWARRFGRDPSVVGATLTLDGEGYTVVGVMPRGFPFLDEIPDIWFPFRQDPAGTGRGNHSMEAVARLAPGADLASAQREVSALADRLARDFPDTNEGWGARVLSVREDFLGDIAKQASFILMGAVGFVLLMACVNVANLLLARAANRRLEMSIRTALGAGRGRLLRQLLTESGVLAASGGVLGVLLSVWGSRAIIAGLPDTMPPAFSFEIDGTVLGFSVAVAVASALIFGMVPALRGSRGRASALRDGGRSSVGDGRGRFGSTLVVVQTALAVVLLVGAGIMIQSVAGMRTQDFGYEPEGVLTMAVRPPQAGYPDGQALNRFYDQVLEQVRSLPGVVAAGTIHSPPLAGSNSIGTFRIQGVPTEDGVPARFAWVSTEYFEAMEIEVVRGRAFDDSDGPDAPRRIVVNEHLVEHHMPDGMDPLTARLDFGGETIYQVVGVVEDHLERALDDPMEPAIYHPVSQDPTRGRSLMVRTAGPPGGMIDAVRGAVWAVDPDQPVYAVQTMTELIQRRVSGFQLLAELMGVFALISLALGAVGIYGVTAYAVGRRTREIGIRIAMGARSNEVVGMVVKEGMIRAGLGLVIGMALAFALAGALSGVVVGVNPRSPATFLVVGSVLLVVALLGSYVPGLRATGVDPMEALASE